MAALPLVMWRKHSLAFLTADVSTLRLARVPDGAVAPNFFAWLARDGLTDSVLATVLPLLFLGPAIWLLVRRPAVRTSLAIALGPVLVAAGFAVRQLSWWNGLDGALLVLLTVTVAATGRGASFARWAWIGFVGLVCLPGAIQVAAPARAAAKNVLNESEVFGLVERDLARWLASRAGPAGALVLAPHNATVALYYYGGVRGLATQGWENQDGLGAAVRVASASTPEEAKELIDRRGITHIVIPQWDSYLDIYARVGMGQLDGTFLNQLHFWKLPPWLRPVPYQFPSIPGFEGQSVTVLEVVEDQEDVAALSRLAEYFVEMGQLDQAASVAQTLRRFPADLGTLVARAQVELARGDTAAFGRTVELLRSRVAGGADRVMLWDRRVSLAVVLARAKQGDLARQQMQRCLADLDEPKLRSLTTGSLYRLQVLKKAFGLEIADSQLRRLALDLLPADWRGRL